MSGEVEFNAIAYMRLPRPVIEAVKAVPDKEVAQHIANIGGILGSISESPAHLFLVLGAMQASVRIANDVLWNHSHGSAQTVALARALAKVELAIQENAKPPPEYELR